MTDAYQLLLVHEEGRYTYHPKLLLTQRYKVPIGLLSEEVEDDVLWEVAMEPPLRHRSTFDAVVWCETHVLRLPYPIVTQREERVHVTSSTRSDASISRLEPASWGALRSLCQGASPTRDARAMAMVLRVTLPPDEGEAAWDYYLRACAPCNWLMRHHV